VRSKKACQYQTAVGVEWSGKKVPLNKGDAEGRGIKSLVISEIFICTEIRFFHSSIKELKCLLSFNVTIPKYCIQADVEMAYALTY